MEVASHSVMGVLIQARIPLSDAMMHPGLPRWGGGVVHQALSVSVEGIWPAQAIILIPSVMWPQGPSLHDGGSALLKVLQKVCWSRQQNPSLDLFSQWKSLP